MQKRTVISRRTIYERKSPATAAGIFLIPLVIISVSCREIFFSGQEITREIPVEGFHSVEISGIFNVFLIQDSADYIVISGNNSPGKINASVSDSTLVIHDPGRLKVNTSKNSLYIHFTTIKYLAAYDPVNITGKGIIRSDRIIFDALGEIINARLTVDCSFFQLVSSGNTLGSFHISGKATDCYFFNRYGSSVSADSLMCNTAAIINESVSDVRVRVAGNILAWIHGSGNILYRGSPTVEIPEIRGSGRVIKVGD